MCKNNLSREFTQQPQTLNCCITEQAYYQIDHRFTKIDKIYHNITSEISRKWSIISEIIASLPKHLIRSTPKVENIQPYKVYHDAYWETSSFVSSRSSVIDSGISFSRLWLRFSSVKDSENIVGKETKEDDDGNEEEGTVRSFFGLDDALTFGNQFGLKR